MTRRQKGIMKNILVSNEFNGFKRLEVRSDEYMIHEDYLFLARDCEAAAREYYIIEHTKDENQKQSALSRLEVINAGIERRFELIKGYRKEKQND